SEITIERGKNREQREGNVFDAAKELLQQHTPASVPGLPPFTAGAVGFCSYDIIRQLEKIGDSTKDDLHLPDCVLMFYDRLLAFDHLRHQIHIIAAADVSNESPRKAYDRALRDIAGLEKKLSSGTAVREWGAHAKRPSTKLKVHPLTSRKDYEQ